ncbi:acetate--CoA ligase family protein [Rhodopirellula bahusiensis]
MNAHNLDKIFRPRSVAVIGASSRIGSVGNTVLRNLVDGQFSGDVYPVNPKYKFVEDFQCFGSVKELTNAIDLAVVCTPAPTVCSVVRECGEAGILGLVIITAGFRETGEAGRRMESDLAVVAKSFPGMRVIGPNCLGILSPHQHLNASFAADMPPAGNVAFISQSGALCTAMLDWAITENVGFSQFVSVGNAMDITMANLIEYFADDGHTDAIILYIESLTDARNFMSAARDFTKTKPILAYKSGRFEQSAQAAASHTGAMAGVDAVYEAAFARAGIVRVFKIEDLFDGAEYLARKPQTRGERLAIVTNAGGPGVMATDALLTHGGQLAALSPETTETLNVQLPATWSHCNPVDVIGDATPERFAFAINAVLRDPNVDALLVILSPQSMTEPSGVAEAVFEASEYSSKPILASWMGGRRVAEGVELLTAGGIPTYSTPEKCVRVFMHLVQHEQNRETLLETPHEVLLDFPMDCEARKRIVASSTTSLIESSYLSEDESKSILEAYGIATTHTEVARSKQAAVEIADRLGYPIVAKVHSRQITHKTDVHGVELNLQNAKEVAAAYDAIIQRAEQQRPDAEIEGITVQPMLAKPLARELIVGAKRDPVFGPVILAGAGGITAELYHDRALQLPPLNKRLARRMLQSLKIYPLLSGFRGRRGVDVDAVVDVLLRVATLVLECPQIAELDINPLLVHERGAIAVDARIVVG